MPTHSVCCKCQVIGGWKAGTMKLRSIVVLLFSLAAQFAMAQRVASSGDGFEPLLPQQVLADTNDEASKAMGDLLAITPDIPRGPLDLLREYRDQMTLISQRFSVELDAIAQAVRNGQLRPEDAEYLIQQGFQIAVMQYEVFRALHDSLAYEVAKQSVPYPPTSSPSNSTVVVVDPPWARTSKSNASN